MLFIIIHHHIISPPHTKPLQLVVDGIWKWNGRNGLYVLTLCVFHRFMLLDSPKDNYHHRVWAMDSNLGAIDGWHSGSRSGLLVDEKIVSNKGEGLKI